VQALQITTFQLTRVWAALTGIALAAWYFAALWLGFAPAETLPMLVAGIGGFELVLSAQDLARSRRKRQHG
jgi:hypothetical protein